MVSNDAWDVAQLVEDQLTSRFGYEVLHAELGWYRKICDAQHGVHVKTHRSPSGDAVSMEFGFCRRDINELLIEIAGDHWRIGERLDEPWSETMADRWAVRLFEHEGKARWLDLSAQPDEVVDWLEHWIPRLDDHASLSKIESHYDAFAARLKDAPEGTVLLAILNSRRMANQMLHGWRGEQDDSEYLVPLARDAEADETLVPVIEAARAWIAAHPDGIERELAG